MLATTHINYPLKKIKDMYKLRWRVEISFKRLKSYLNLNKIFSLCENFWKQEMQLRILLDSLIRISQVKIKSKILQCKTKKIRQTYKKVLLLFLFKAYFRVNNHGTSKESVVCKEYTNQKKAKQKNIIGTISVNVI
jgi:hypothetical protein